jgi:hypothetical protein
MSQIIRNNATLFAISVALFFGAAALIWAFVVGMPLASTNQVYQSTEGVRR